MELEEIEQKYSIGISQANEFFINGLKDKKEKSLLEKKYKEKLENVRKEYYNEIKKYIKKRKDKKILEKKPIQNKEKLNEKTKIRSKLYFKFLLIKFRIKILIRRIRDKEKISNIIFIYKKNRVKAKHTFSEIRRRTDYISQNIKELAMKTYDMTKELVKKAIIYSKDKSEKIRSKISKKKKEEKTNSNQNK